MTEKRLSASLRGTPERRPLEITTEERDKKKPENLESKSCSGKQVVALIMASIAGCLFWDVFLTPPEKRWLRPDTSERFLEWAEANPYSGFWAFLLVIASCVVLMIPMGTPLTLGCGYIYKGVYGWGFGLLVATTVSVLGSGLGAVMCFLLGRYLMRDRVRKWIRNYPLFDAIDVGKCIIIIKTVGHRTLPRCSRKSNLIHSNIGTGSANNGNALLNSSSSIRTSVLHVRNNVNGSVLLHDCQGRFASYNDSILLHRSIDGNPFVRSHWSRSEKD